ncbi:type I polyketide synthase [Streptacidiphilus fuscans]|uniref:SDR family NAD(P)-dependent oxidoreductase n=1 Tax=Streptacidiphilus fuscans TaxID=2789292 RepID=A0A931FCF3_9ACTN|nr:type I polyketide synthase [Streptacidiphilus fuscans]MBF9068418.1 SDR family NAD(P)-dependent oxidoreductase [Streptacidiphilus fuscans]
MQPSHDTAAPSSAAPATTPLTRAMDTIRRLRAQLDAASGPQPLAVVGIGLRLPGGIDDLDGFWQALSGGADLVRQMPRSRMGRFAPEWETLPHRGGFLDEVLEFDADYFGISPREARGLDPQHRLLLEVAAEALDDAAITPESLADARTGLYVGITGQDYRDWMQGEPDAYWATGNGHCFAAGRLSYTLGLTGPAMAVDTACSSSLVAVHLARQALRRGECDTALVGGVNLVLSPRSTRLVEQTRSLAPDGLCKPFDARANGFTRGEGAGVLVLKRLDDAVRDGDRIHAVIQGSAVNQDGRSSGFTAPNVLAQTALIGEALKDAGLEPADIGLVEAHGTGTSLGDPIEMEGLAGALGRRNSGAPVHVGSVKANVGHLEAAAGIAGLIKAVLCLKEKAVPPLVHFRTLNPRIELDGTGITFAQELTEWNPKGSGGRYAGVSSFGMSGTNAHIVLGAAPEAAAVDAQAVDNIDGMDNAEPTGFELSAATPGALRQLARRHEEALRAATDADYAAYAYTVTLGRSRQAVRARVAASDRAAALKALAALAAGTPDASVTLVDDATPEALTSLPRQVLTLPAYPWQRQRHAPEESAVETAVETPVADTASLARQALAWRPWSAPVEGSATDQLVLAGDDAAMLSLLASRAAAGTVLAPAGVADLALAGGWDRAELPRTRAEWEQFWAARPAGPATLALAFRATALPDAAGDADPAAAGAALCAATTDAVLALGAADGRAFALTLGSRPVRDGDAISATDHGLLHGLAPVLGLESPRSWGGVVDLPAEPTEADADALLRLLAAPNGEDLAAVRDGEVLVARVTTSESSNVEPLTIRPDATYLLTGGLGGVGRALIADFVRRGARHLLLLGRRSEAELAEPARELLASLRADGVQARYAAADVADPVALAEALASATAEAPGLPEIRGVVHAAGTLPRGALADADTDAYLAALRGKFDGAWWLHLQSVSGQWPLDFFVQTSSVSALWGTDGYGAYAAANGGLDAIGAIRAAAGLPSSVVAFGPWALDGMADADSRADLARMGVVSLTPETGAAALALPASGNDPLLLACEVDWPRFVPVMSSRRARPLFDEVAPKSAATAAASGTPTAQPTAVGTGAAEVLALPEAVRAAGLRTRVGRAVAAILGHAEGRTIEEDRGFLDLGLDSIMASDLATGLADEYAVPLSVTDVFDHPTVAELTDRLLELIVPVTPVAPVAAAPVTAPAPAPVAAPAPVVAPVTPAATVPVPVERVTVLEPATPATPAAHEPIAIVGMAGRFPGADSTEELWTLLREGRDGVGAVTTDLWDRERLTDPDPVKAGRITTDQGGFLTDRARFDAGFFGIPAREARSLDPQHRLLLEVAWHALEDSGTDPHGLKGSRTGVWLGISNSDYARLLERDGLDQLDAYYSTGTALNAAAGRLAFLLGLNGPALAIDTACSSSLVALHLAMRSLRSGETDTALTAGVNVIASPECSVAVSRAHMLSPEGRCKTFSAEADGFVRAEGCGVLVLKRLSDAERDGDRVLAVLHGSAVNQDGASSGLTAPSGKAQQAVIAAALADANVTGADIDYLEAHGTGTALGDPIELNAAWSAFGGGREPGRPLLIGSVKSNIGHCESASGVAAVIKTVLALRHGVLPANLHADSRNPRVPWREMNLRVVDEAIPWRAGANGGKPRLAGVSGFGFSGTNAHVIVGEAAPRPATHAGSGEEQAEGPFLLPLSAPDAEGLTRVAATWRDRLAQATDAQVAGLAVTAGRGRAHLGVRRAVVGRSRDELVSALDKQEAHGPAERAPKVAFLFSGQGSQYFGMGRRLYESEPVFRETFDACDRIAAPALGISLHQLLFHGVEKDLVNQTRYTQPALVSLELALAELWRSWGVTASAVIGHSVGEVAAAIHAGVLSLEAGLALITERARLMQGTEHGGMLAVAATLEQVTEWVAESGLGIDIAAVNGPSAVVVAGAPELLAEFAARMKERKVQARNLVVSHAFHSRLMEPILPQLEAVMAPFSFAAPRIPIVSNVTGKLARPDEYDPAYWGRHVRRPVMFHQGASQLAELDIDFCLEIGPDRTLGNLVAAAGLAPAGGVAPSLRRGGDERTTMLAAAQALYQQGTELNWGAVQAATGADRAEAPRYPFAATRYWTTTSATADEGSSAAAEAAPRSTRHWGSELHSPALSGRAFSFERRSDFPAYLTDHRLYGTVVTPAASHLATVLSALAGDGRPFAVEDLVCPRALVIKDGERYETQILVDSRELSVHSLLDPERGVWQRHISGRVGEPRPALHSTPDRAAFQASAERHISGAEFYQYFRELGYTLGPSFRWIADVWIRGTEALVRYAQPELPDPVGNYEIYPGLIDSSFQSIAGFMVDDVAEEAPSLAIPFAATRISFPGRPETGEELWGHVSVTRAEPLPNGRSRVETADLHMFRADGASVMVADGFRVRHAPRAVLEHSLRGGVAHAYTLGWYPLAQDADQAEQASLRIRLVGGTNSRAKALTKALRGQGHTLTTSAKGSADLVLDARLLAFGDDAPAGAAEALAATTGLAVQLAELTDENSKRAPYVVLAGADAATAPARESVWGMLAALEVEDAQRRLLRVALEPDWQASDLAGLLGRAAAADVAESRFALGADGIRVARLEATEDAPEEPHWNGGVLITGGLGALGLSVARTVAAQGAPAVTLMGRSQPDEVARAVIAELEQSGVAVSVVAGDVTRAEDCALAVAKASATTPLRGIFHLAGGTDDRPFDQLTPESFDRVFAAKVFGAENLAQAASEAGQELDAFVLFSSVSALLGSAGQVNYAAANGYLDGLAQRLRASGVPATAVNWGPWVPQDRPGLAGNAVVSRAAERMGVKPLGDEEARPLLALAVAGGLTRMAAVALDPARYAERLAGSPASALVERLIPTDAPDAHSPAAAPAAGDRGGLRRRLAEVPGAVREELLLESVRELVGRLLGDPGAVRDSVGFADLGLDSIMVIDLRSELEHALDLDLPATVAIDHPTVSALTRCLAELLSEEEQADEPALAAPVTSLPAPNAPNAESEQAADADLGGLSLDELLEAVRHDLSN